MTKEEMVEALNFITESVIHVRDVLEKSRIKFRRLRKRSRRKNRSDLSKTGHSANWDFANG